MPRTSLAVALAVLALAVVPGGAHALTEWCQALECWPPYHVERRAEEARDAAAALASELAADAEAQAVAATAAVARAAQDLPVACTCDPIALPEPGTSACGGWLAEPEGRGRVAGHAWSAANTALSAAQRRPVDPGSLVAWGVFEAGYGARSAGALAACAVAR